MTPASQIAQKTLLIVLSITLIIACYPAIKMTGANLQFYKASQLQAHWLKNNSLTNKPQYLTAVNAISNANAAHLNNPRYLAEQGLIHEWAGISAIFNKDDQQKNLLAAKHFYLKAVELRPTWPTTWASLALLKWRLNEMDQELIHYLIQADKFGANMDDVHNAWLDIGLYLYKSKSQYTVQIIKKLRSHLKTIASNSRPFYRNKAISIIKRHNAQKQACMWLSNDNGYNKDFHVKLCSD